MTARRLEQSHLPTTMKHHAGRHHGHARLQPEVGWKLIRQCATMARRSLAYRNVVSICSAANLLFSMGFHFRITCSQFAWFRKCQQVTCYSRGNRSIDECGENATYARTIVKALAGTDPRLRPGWQCATPPNQHCLCQHKQN